MGYISKQGLENLPKYKSSETVDNSILYKNIVSPVCDILVQYLPLWLAPNLITTIGGVCNVTGFLLAVFFVGIGTSDSPLIRYIALINGCLIFSNMMLDNMDGKQARRTKSSSPLGELVDHGCDSLCVALATVMTGLIVGADGEAILAFFALCGITFYLAHWEEYFTHHLILGAFTGPVETEVLIAIIHWITFFVGRPFWTSTAFILQGHDITYLNLLMVAFFAGSMWTTVSSVFYGLGKAKKRGVSMPFALSQLMPITITYIAGTVWVVANYKFFTEHPLLFVSTFGLVFSFLVIRCIVERICNESFRLFYKVMIPLLIAAANASMNFFNIAPPVQEEHMLYFAAICALGGWFHLAHSVMSAMCETLGIRPFSIPYTLPR
jgi:ethanolaminephosphotransferase